MKTYQFFGRARYLLLFVLLLFLLGGATTVSGQIDRYKEKKEGLRKRLLPQVVSLERSFLDNKQSLDDVVAVRFIVLEAFNAMQEPLSNMTKKPWVTHAENFKNAAKALDTICTGTLDLTTQRHYLMEARRKVENSCQWLRETDFVGAIAEHGLPWQFWLILTMLPTVILPGFAAHWNKGALDTSFLFREIISPKRQLWMLSYTLLPFVILELFTPTGAIVFWPSATVVVFVWVFLGIIIESFLEIPYTYSCLIRLYRLKSPVTC